MVYVREGIYRLDDVTAVTGALAPDVPKPDTCWRTCAPTRTRVVTDAAVQKMYLRSRRVRGLHPQMGQVNVSAAMVFLQPGHFRRAIGTSALKSTG